MVSKLRTVLFVEDDDDHAELVLRSLEAEGLEKEVTRVSDGEAALDYLYGRGAFAAPRPPRPDIVLLDLRLPKVDGLQVLREIKSSESLQRIPVVVLTTSEAESDLARAYDLRANAYVVKPVDFAKFGTLLRDLGFFWLGWNRQPPSTSGTGSGS